MDGGQRDEDWLRIRRMASLSARGGKSAQAHTFETPPSPLLLPLKDDTSPYLGSPDTERLWASSPGTQQPNRYEQRQTSSFSGISTPLLFALSIYSTLLSCVWFLIAVIKPHYNMFISEVGGTISPSTASTIVAGAAKTIELSFITVAITCLGQFFTKQAFNGASPGISLADIQLKTMIVQPGSLLTQWRSYAQIWRSVIGLLALLACLTAVLYTTASDALVTPVPSLHPAVTMSLVSSVRTSIANLYYLEGNCKTPFFQNDPLYAGGACLAVEGAGSAYHTFMAYLTSWNQSTASGASVPLAKRPLPIAQIYDNVTVQGSWVEPISVFSRDSRVVSNVSMALPHAGLIAASALANNGLLQVNAASTAAELDVDAQTVLPVMNVLCATSNASDLLPLSYKNFTNASPNITTNNWPFGFDSAGWRNETVFDGIFNFSSSRPPPLFYKLPMVYNTILNDSGAYPDALYILSNSNISSPQPYTLCSLSMTVRSGCSTKYRSRVSGSLLSSDCSPGNPMAYIPTPANNGSTWMRNRDWVSVASDWALATSLHGGISDTNASTSRVVTEFASINDTLSPYRATLPEVLAILASNTLLTSTTDAAFDGEWPFSKEIAPTNVLANPTLEPFTANVQISDYASGGSAPWQNIFVLILIPVFLLNCLCLAYLAYITLPQRWLPKGHYVHLHRRSVRGEEDTYSTQPLQHYHPYLHAGVQRDFTDLQNLFTLALGTAEPREGSLMKGTGGTWPKPHNEGKPNPGARTWFLNRSTLHPGIQAEREERYRLLATKWHIKEKPPARPLQDDSAGLGLGMGLDSSVEGTPNLDGGLSRNMYGHTGYFGAGSYHSSPGTGAAPGTRGYHIVVDGEEGGQQHHFRRRGPSNAHMNTNARAKIYGETGKERVRGRFEKYLSARSQSFPLASTGKEHSPSTSVEGGNADVARERHISGPITVRNSVGIEPAHAPVHVHTADPDTDPDPESSYAVPDAEQPRGRARDSAPPQIGPIAGLSSHPASRDPSLHGGNHDGHEDADMGVWRSPVFEQHQQQQMDSGWFSGTTYSDGSGGGTSAGDTGTGRPRGEEYEFVELGPGVPGMGREV